MKRIRCGNECEMHLPRTIALKFLCKKFCQRTGLHIFWKHFIMHQQINCCLVDRHKCDFETKQHHARNCICSHSLKILKINPNVFLWLADKLFQTDSVMSTEEVKQCHPQSAHTPEAIWIFQPNRRHHFFNQVDSKLVEVNITTSHALHRRIGHLGGCVIQER